MRSFKNFQEALVQKKREARNRIFTNKEFPSWKEYGFRFISTWEPNLVCCDSGGCFDKYYGFGFSKKNIIESVSDLCLNKDKDFLSVGYEQRYDLYNNSAREGELHENYIPEVDFADLDIWNNKEGWLF